MKTSVVVGFKDNMSKPAAASLKTMTDAAVKASTGIVNGNQKAVVSNEKLLASAAKAASGIHAMYRDRERLGVRSEQTIQREIRITEAAYGRLTKSGNLSWREQIRAAEAMRTRVRELNNEMGKFTAAQRAAQGGRIAAGVVAGGVAATMLLKPKFDAALGWDERLRNMANTAYAGQPLAARRAGKSVLDDMVTNAVRLGGGTRDQAALTLDAMIASGAVSTRDSGKMLPTIMKASTASGADAVDLAGIGIRGMQTFKVQADDMSKLIDMAIAAGQAGGFELKDMARWLPQQMAAGVQLGLSGTPGFARLVSLNQAAAITAGTKDEAGNNLVNLLAKINSRETALDAKKFGINLPQYLAQERGKGIDSVDAFVNLTDRIVQKNPAYQQLQTKLAGAKGDAEKREALDSMVSIVQGSAVGQIVQDRQALMALVGILNNRSYIADVQKSVNASRGVTQDNYNLIAEGPAYKARQLGNENAIALQRGMDTLTPAIGGLAEKTTGLAREYPAFTSAVVLSTTALAALAAAGGSAALLGTLTGGSESKLAGGGKKILGLAGRAAAVGGAALTGWEIGQWLGNNAVNPMINWGVSKLSGHQTNLGAFLYDLTHKTQQVGGEIRIKIDSDGIGRVQSTKTNQPGMKFAVHNGPYMGVSG